MITTTLRDVLAGNLTGTYRVYAFLDAQGDLLYVGKSVCAETRILSHVGRGEWKFLRQEIGQFLIDNLPESLDWKIELYSEKDCKVVYPYTICRFKYRIL